MPVGVVAARSPRRRRSSVAFGADLRSQLGAGPVQLEDIGDDVRVAGEGVPVEGYAGSCEGVVQSRRYSVCEGGELSHMKARSVRWVCT